MHLYIYTFSVMTIYTVYILTAESPFQLAIERSIHQVVSNCDFCDFASALFVGPSNLLLYLQLQALLLVPYRSIKR